MNPLSLLELNSLVREVLGHTFAGQTYWLQAELSSVSEHGSHCYMEFVQKGERDNDIIAQAKGHVWGNRWGLIRTYFQQAAGQPLAAGMQVLVEVEITFHERFGYALNVVDIDPTYTLGNLARHRREILQALQREGVADMNKELPLPRLLQRIAVISSATAAGYQDFCRQLEQNPSHLVFHTRLFPAIMQGQQVESTLISALENIAAELNQWDAVVIIRGGGSTIDLSGFDTLPLAENVSQFPLPIITGIGHERDDTVIDLVAHTRVKTPTAAAQFLIQHQQAELDHLTEMTNSLTERTTLWLRTDRQRLQFLTSQMPALSHLLFSQAALRLQRLQAILHETSQHPIHLQHNHLNILQERLRQYAETLLANHRHQLQIFETNLRAAQPDRLLRLGFSITRLNGHAVTDSTTLKQGDLLTTTLAQGTVTSQVKQKQRNNEKRKT